jgi:riboflavin kinase
MEISGKLFSGIGEGRVYVEKYLQHLEETLGFKPFLGTLNLKVNKIPATLFKNPITIKPPEKGLFPVECVKASVEEIEAAVVRPGKTAHGSDVLEVLAPVCLRKELDLNDGDTVKVMV